MYAVDWNKWRSYPHRGQYPITDCEHEGDIISAIHEVENAGGIFDGQEWDGEDGGDARIYFHCKDAEQLLKVKKILGID